MRKSTKPSLKFLTALSFCVFIFSSLLFFLVFSLSSSDVVVSDPVVSSVFVCSDYHKALFGFDSSGWIRVNSSYYGYNCTMENK